MRVNGKDYDLRPLTVGDLKRAIAAAEAGGRSVDDYPIHFLVMEDKADDDISAYATHVDIDAFDGTEGDPEHQDHRSHYALCLYHEPGRP